jgi:hypothetical protein
MKILNAQFQVLLLLLLGAFLLIPSPADARRVLGQGTFRDLKGPPVDAGPAPELREVYLRMAGSPEGPGDPFCEVQPSGVCKVDLANFPTLTVCDHYVGFFVFGFDPAGNPNPSPLRFDVTCITDITIIFEGIFAGPTVLHDTFTVYADGTPTSGGYFTGPAICNCTFTVGSTVLGPGRVDFIPNNGTFNGEFAGSGSFRINRAYGAVIGVTGFGRFNGTIGQQGEYTAVINIPVE